MGYLKCKECGDKYKLKKGESPDDFDVCHCGGEIEYLLSSHELKKRTVNVYSEEENEETVKKRSSDKIVIIILAIFAALILMALPALLIYRAYFTGP